MPVVWHERKGKEFNRIFLKPLAKDANERFIVFRFMKNFMPRISTIDRVLANPSLVDSLLPRHHSSPVMEKRQFTNKANTKLPPSPFLRRDIERRVVRSAWKDWTEQEKLE